MAKGKYDLDGPFNDPVIICCDCQAIIHREVLSQEGCCPKCGNKRVRRVKRFEDTDLLWALNKSEAPDKDGHYKVYKTDFKSLDPEFLSLFEASE